MKTLHLICNSHLDPVWMWDWQEGAASAISTFRQAAKFCDEFDYVFCHNEALLYEYIEEYEPELFKKIQKLVKIGKWKIMGGWYLQPDCNLPSGEAFVRQIECGRKYFAEKFCARPTIAVNFDSFGHSIGLVQILGKTGYEGYLCCRPMSWWKKGMAKLPDSEFMWFGKDGSKIKVARIDDISLYSSGFGTAKADIERKAAMYKEKPVGAALWGVGNHGGNPSRKDLKDVSEMIAAAEINGENVEIKHSTPENFFAEAEFKKQFDKSMQPCLVGCYSSMSRVKKKNAELETALFETEKLCAFAKLNGYISEIDENLFDEAQKILAKFQFHDLLAGTVCRAAEKTSLEMAGSALTMLKKAYDKTFFACLEHENKAEEGEFPIFVFNSLPFNRKAVVEAEFLVLDSLASDTEQYSVTVKQNGKVVKSQVIKESVNINYDRRKRLAIYGDLPAFGIARFDVTIKKEPKVFFEKPSGNIIEKSAYKSIIVEKSLGCMTEFSVKENNLLKGEAFRPVIFNDYPDPWGWDMERIGDKPEDMILSDCKKGLFAGLENVNVIENGDVLTEVESLYEGGSSFVRVSYKIYKELPYVDVAVNVLWSEKDKALKLRVPVALKGKFIGQIPYASDEFAKDGKEITAQRFVAVTDCENAMYIANDGVYGFSMDGDDFYITLLRGVAYCAHPIGDRPLLEKDRYIPFVESGEHTFNFRIGYCKISEIENAALEFTSKKEGLNYYPNGKKEEAKAFVLSNKTISLSACRAVGESYELRLFNNSAYPINCEIACGNVKASFLFGKYEVKTVIFDGKIFKESSVWI